MTWLLTKELYEGVRRHLSWVRRKYQLEKGIPHMAVGYHATTFQCTFEGCNRLGDESQAYASTIGKFTYYGCHTRINRCTVGRFCSIGSYVSLGLWSHPVKRNVSTHPIFYSSVGQAGGVRWLHEGTETESEPVTIGHDVWIGDFAMVRGGIKIGNGAVIGAGAIVTKDVPAYAVVVGVPARVSRMRFSEEEISWLQSSRWWDLPEDKLQKMIPDFRKLDQLRASNTLIPLLQNQVSQHNKSKIE